MACAFAVAAYAHTHTNTKLTHETKIVAINYTWQKPEVKDVERNVRGCCCHCSTSIREKANTKRNLP